MNTSLEWEFAAHWRGYSREAFAALDGTDQARIVALYRVQQQMQAILVKTQMDEARRA